MATKPVASLFCLKAAVILIACQGPIPEGPGPERTGGFLVDYGNCRVGQDVFSPGDPRIHATWQGLGRRHGGIDIFEAAGTPVVAAAPGRVSYIRRKIAGSAGKYVQIDHSGFFTGYFHLSDIQPELRLGDYVQRGQPIGALGQTGASSAHLHFDLRYEMKLGGLLPNLHEYWYVPNEDRQKKIVTVPYFEGNKAYSDDHRITAPILAKDCKNGANRSS